jgi:protein ImuB
MMRRVISVWFPTFPAGAAADRCDAGDQRTFTASAHDGRRRIVAAANAAAQAAGVIAGMPLASAQALVPGLGTIEGEHHRADTARGR